MLVWHTPRNCNLVGWGWFCVYATHRLSIMPQTAEVFYVQRVFCLMITKNIIYLHDSLVDYLSQRRLKHVTRIILIY